MNKKTVAKKCIARKRRFKRLYMEMHLNGLDPRKIEAMKEDVKYVKQKVIQHDLQVRDFKVMFSESDINEIQCKKSHLHNRLHRNTSLFRVLTIS